MIEINLLPPEHRKREKKEFKMPELPYKRLFILFLVALVVLEGSLFSIVVVKKNQSVSLRKELKMLLPEIERFKGIRSETNMLQGRLKEMNRMSERPFYWTHLLNALSDSMTEGVWLTRIRVERQLAQVGKKKQMRVRKTAKDRLAKSESSQSQTDDGTKYILIVRGSVASVEQGTATIGKFIQTLQKNAFLDKIISEIWLEKIDRQVEKETQRFDFTVACMFKEEFKNDFDIAF